MTERSAGTREGRTAARKELLEREAELGATRREEFEDA
jgi:hypothetical protein